MSEPYSAAPRPGSSEDHVYVPGESAVPGASTSTAYAPVAPRPAAGVGDAYAEALARASGAMMGGAAPSPSGNPGGRGLRTSFRFPGTESLDPAKIFRGSGYEAPRPEVSGMARWALGFSLLGFIPFLSPIGLGLGLGSLGETADGRRSGRGSAEAEVSLGAMGTIGWLLILTAYLFNR